MSVTFQRRFIFDSDSQSDPLPNVSGIWTWFTDPRCVYYNGSFYVSFLDTNDVTIIKIDQSGLVLATFVLKSNLQTDDHANPSILIRPDGKLQCFYSAHNGANMFYRISTNPEDISSWENEQTLGTNLAGGNGYTYTNPFYISSESKYYIFWRGASWDIAYSTSLDGQTWGTAEAFFSTQGERPYFKYASNNTNILMFAFTDGHPNEVSNNSIYFMKYIDGEFEKADGTLIGTFNDIPFAPEDADKVYDSVATGVKAWIWDVSMDSNDNPVIVYSTFQNQRNHIYRYARWTGSEWEDHEVIAGGDYLYSPEIYYSGGICLDQSDPSIVYTSRKIKDFYEIGEMQTNDNGLSWRYTPITLNSTSKNLRPTSVRNYPRPSSLWFRGTYTTYENYNTRIVSRIKS